LLALVEAHPIFHVSRIRVKVLYRPEEGKNFLPKVDTRKANWIGHILCRSRLLKHVIEGKMEGRIEVTERRGNRRKQLLDSFKEREDTGN
jgi:hypothetical protein